MIITDKGCNEIYSTPQRVKPSFDKIDIDIKEVRVGPKCSGVILGPHGDLYVCGRNKGSRLFLPNDSNTLVLANIDSITDIRFGPGHSVVLKKDGKVVTSTGHKNVMIKIPGAKDSEGDSGINLHKEKKNLNLIN